MTTADYVADEMAEQSGVVQVSYSTGNSGAKLTWRSPEPRPEDESHLLRQAQYAESAGGQSPPQLDTPFRDPFQDRPLAAEDAPPAEMNEDLQLRPDESQPPAQAPGAQATPGQGRPPATSQSDLERVLAAGPGIGMAPCPSPKDLPKITDISVDIRPDQTGLLPRECPLTFEVFQPREFCDTTVLWRSTCLCHKPLYFEDVGLERYGHTWGPFLQPVLSGAHFFLSVPVLPYKMGLTPPTECIYTLGYYRPGSCAPYTLDPLPLSARAFLFQGIAATGVVFWLP